MKVRVWRSAPTLIKGGTDTGAGVQDIEGREVPAPAPVSAFELPDARGN